MWLIRNLINLKHNRNFIRGVKNARSWKENLLGGALCSAGGAGVDYLNNTRYTNQEANLNDALVKMGEEGALSLLGDTAVKGAGKLIDVGYEPTKKALAKGAQIADKITEALPAMSVAKKTIKGLPTANVDGAQESIKAMRI